jgi:DNA polymerase III alpha subunit (gram-positive type)
MKENLLRFNKRQRYLIFDTETEGLNLVNSRPWQIAWILAEGDKILEKHDLYIKWEDLNISDEAAKITGFSKQLYDKKSLDPKEVYNKFSKYLEDESSLIVGQNLLGFDVYMINIWRKKIGLNSDYSFVNRIIDTKSIATAIAKDIPPPSKDNLLSWQYRLLNHKEKGLKTSQLTLLKKYDIPHDAKRLHDAMYDIEMNFRIFRKQLFEIEL